MKYVARPFPYATEARVVLLCRNRKAPIGCMPVCVHCGRPVPAVVAKFGSGHVVLARCVYNDCGHVVDPYLEYGLAVLVIDLVRLS